MPLSAFSRALPAVSSLAWFRQGAQVPRALPAQRAPRVPRVPLALRDLRGPSAELAHPVPRDLPDLRDRPRQ